MFIEIAATDNADSLFGTSANEVSSLLAGNDYFSGASGTDVVNGNTGNDTINGENGNDTLYGGKDQDSINGGSGLDFINGNMGNDTISDFEGSNTLRGGQGDDVISGAGQLFGDLGNDRLEGNAYTAESFYGGQGADTFVVTFPPRLATVDTIKDFNFAEGDRIDIDNDRSIKIGTLQSGNGAYISYENPITLFSYYVVLEGVDPYAINSSWFI